MDEEINVSFDENLNQLLDELEEMLQSNAATENVVMPFQHAFPSEAFLTSTHFTVQQATPAGVPNHPTPAFIGHGETWNTSRLSEQSSVIQNFSTHQPIPFQGENACLENYHINNVEESKMHFTYEQNASGKLPVISSTLETFYVDPSASIENYSISVRNSNNIYEMSASNSEVSVIGQGFYEHPDPKQCPVKDIGMDSVEESDQYSKGFSNINAEKNSSFGIKEPAETGFDIPRLVDPPSGEAVSSAQIRTNPKHLEMPGTIAGSFEGPGTENCNPDPSARSNVCTKCRKVYATKRGLVLHQKRKHATDKLLPFACEYCDKRFVSISELQKKTCSCSHWGETLCVRSVQHRFFSKRLFKRHLSVHSEEKRFVCPVCYKGYSRNDYLKRHTFVHTGKERFVRKQCHKVFPKILTYKHVQGSTL